MKLARIIMALSAFISSLPSNPVLAPTRSLDDKVGEKLVALNGNLSFARRE
jgi:hypothetical protein